MHITRTLEATPVNGMQLFLMSLKTTVLFLLWQAKMSAVKHLLSQSCVRATLWREEEEESELALAIWL